MSKSVGELSALSGVCTIVMTAVGLGILGLPRSVSEVGPMTFLVLCPLLTVICWGMADLFAQTLAKLPEKTNFIHAGEKSSGLFGRVVSALVFNSAVIGVCACMLKLFNETAGTYIAVSPREHKELRLSVIGTAVCLPFVWVRSNKNMALLSAVGVGSVSALCLTIVIAGLTQIGNDSHLKRSSTPEFWHRANGIEILGQNISNMVFTFGAIPAIAGVYANLKNPHHMRSVNFIAYIFIMLVNLSLAYTGFFAWNQLLQTSKTGDGNDAHGKTILQILAHRNKFDLKALVSHFSATLVVFTHLIVLWRPAADFFETLGNQFRVYRFISRSLPPVLSLMMAVSRKTLDNLMGVVASFSVTLLIVVLPPIYFFKITRNRNPFLIVSCLVSISLALFGSYHNLVSAFDLRGSQIPQ